MSEDPGIEPARPADADVIGRMHAGQISEGFLASLGPGFLSLLYDAMASSPSTVLLVARAEGRVIGFVAGSPQPGAFFAEFRRRHLLGASVRIAPRALRPKVFRGVVESMRYMWEEGEGGPELFAIAVDLSSRRAGTGTILVRSLEQQLRDNGETSLSVVVGSANQGARAFYERLGFRLAGELAVHRGEPSVRYTKSLSGGLAR
ncbi:MAG: GNAT family N-acetyltransferase [Actinomycetota bacterium]